MKQKTGKKRTPVEIICIVAGVFIIVTAIMMLLWFTSIRYSFYERPPVKETTYEGLAEAVELSPDMILIPIEETGDYTSYQYIITYTRRLKWSGKPFEIEGYTYAGHYGNQKDGKHVAVFCDPAPRSSKETSPAEVDQKIGELVTESVTSIVKDGYEYTFRANHDEYVDREKLAKVMKEVLADS